MRLASHGPSAVPDPLNLVGSFPAGSSQRACPPRQRNRPGAPERRLLGLRQLLGYLAEQRHLLS